jgi:hypothetical protein
MSVSSTVEEAAVAPGARAAAGDRAGRYLFGPFVDFFCLGGGSLLFFAVLLLLPPIDGFRAHVATLVVILMYVINQPHFANSYQIFYLGFFRKAFGREYGAVLRARYIIAGIVVPVLLALFFAVSIVAENLGAVAFGANIMLFLVGWHYAKQGYGIIIVDSVLKRKFFSDQEKKVLLVNAYAVWASYWVFANWLVSSRDLWGLKYYSFPIADWVLYSAAFATVITTVGGLPVSAESGSRSARRSGAVEPRDYLAHLPIQGARPFREVHCRRPRVGLYRFPWRP